MQVLLIIVKIIGTVLFHSNVFLCKFMCRGSDLCNTKAKEWQIQFGCRLLSSACVCKLLNGSSPISFLQIACLRQIALCPQRPQFAFIKQTFGCCYLTVISYKKICSENVMRMFKKTCYACSLPSMLRYFSMH